MKRIVIVLIVLLLISALNGFSGPRVSNPNHTQSLGGKSTQSAGGLSNAAAHSPAIEAGTSKGDADVVVNPTGK